MESLTHPPDQQRDMAGGCTNRPTGMNDRTNTVPSRPLPRSSDRLRLRDTDLRVSPICIGATESPDTTIAAYEEGINFFFISGDLHWPRYAHTRAGLTRLLEGSPSRRDEIVVAAVSYLDEPFFGLLQFEEILESVPGLERIDVLLAGAVSSDFSLLRITSLQRARTRNHLGAAAIGASFHKRRYMLSSAARHLDIHYVRYNPEFSKSRVDLFPHISPDASLLTFGFQSQAACVPSELFRSLDLPNGSWLPSAGDYYRFALTPDPIDGILCSPSTPEEVRILARALEEKPLTPDEEKYMIRLSHAARALQVGDKNESRGPVHNSHQRPTVSLGGDEASAHSRQ